MTSWDVVPAATEPPIVDRANAMPVASIRLRGCVYMLFLQYENKVQE